MKQTTVIPFITPQVQFEGTRRRADWLTAISSAAALLVGISGCDSFQSGKLSSNKDPEFEQVDSSSKLDMFKPIQAFKPKRIEFPKIPNQQILNRKNTHKDHCSPIPWAGDTVLVCANAKGLQIKNLSEEEE